MCPPVIAGAAAAVQIAGTMVGAMGQAGNLRYEAGVADTNKTLSNAQAKDSILNTNLEAQRARRDQSQTSGRQVAAMAANGVDLGFGSTLDVQRDTAQLGAEDMFQLYKAGNERTKGFETNAFNYRTQAVAKRAQAKGAIINGIFSSVGTALGAASQISGMKGH
jgi:hypothetical protein